MDHPASTFHDTETAVQAIAAMEHAEFDARLVLLLQRKCQWTRSTLPEGVPNFTVAQVHRFLQRRLATVLASQPEMKHQKFHDDRLALRYIASEALELATRTVHLRQLPVENLVEMLRNDLLGVLANMRLDTYFRESPLWNNGQVQRNEKGREFSRIALDRATHRWDIQLLQHVAHADLATLLQESAPHLTSLDDTHIIVAGRDMRQKLWNLLQGKTAFYEQLRENLLLVILEHWHGSFRDPEQTIDTIELETARARCAETWRNVCERDINSMLLANDLMPRCSLEEKRSTLATLAVPMRERHAWCPPITGSDLQAMLDAYIRPLLGQSQPSEQERKTLIRRLPALEWRLLEAVHGLHEFRTRGIGCEADLTHTIMTLQGTLRKLEVRFGLEWHEHPALGFAELATALYADNVDINTFRGAI